MKLRFGIVKNGWLPAELATDDQIFAFDISYLPNDFLLELVLVLTNVLQRPGEWRACLPQEPVEVEWRFFRIENWAVFTLVEYPGSSRQKGTGKKLYEIAGAPLEISLPLWRGVCELRGRKLKESFGEHWRRNWAHPFPDQPLDRLSEVIAEAKG